MSTVLVTGANGFVGSHLVDLLLAEGQAEVRALVRKSSDLRWLEDKPVELCYGEITSSPQELLPAVSGVETVYHLAGSTKALRKQTYYDVNQKGTENLLQACVSGDTPPRLVLMSSAGATGPSPTDEPLREGIEPRPVTEYGRSKLGGEEVAGKFSDRLAISILRPAAIYGPRDMELMPRFKSIKRGLAPHPGLKPDRLNMCHGIDAARAALLAGRSDAAASEAFFVGGENTDQRQIALAAVQALGKKRALRLPIPKPIIRLTLLLSSLAEKVSRKPRIFKHQNARRILARNWTLDHSKAEKVFGYQPRYDLTSGVKNTIEWYLAHDLI